MLKFLINGGTAVDIGANKGLYSYMLAQSADHVICFEPNPALAAKLRLAAPDNCTIQQNAVSDKNEQCVLTIPRSKEGHYAPNTATLEALEGNDSLTFTVESVRLDDLNLQDIRFIKIDVEGHEPSVLKGARTLIASQRPTVLLEINDAQADSAKWIFDYFKDNNYQAMQLMNLRLTALEEYPTTLMERNVLFFPRAMNPA